MNETLWASDDPLCSINNENYTLVFSWSTKAIVYLFIKRFIGVTLL